MVPHHCYSHYSNQFPLQLLKSFLAVFILSFVPTGLALRGVPKSKPDFNDQKYTSVYSLCCNNGLTFVDTLTKSDGKDGIEFRTEQPIKDFDVLKPVEVCCIIDKEAGTIYVELEFNSITEVWLYKNKEYPFGKKLELEPGEYFVRIYQNGKLERILIGVELNKNTFSLKTTRSLCLTGDNMFSVTSFRYWFGELVLIQPDVQGGFVLTKVKPDYYLWTPIIHTDTEGSTTNFFKLLKVGSLKEIRSLKVGGGDETYSLRFGDAFYPWLQTRGKSTNGDWKMTTVEHLLEKQKFPWFVNIYESGSLLVTLVGMFDIKKNSIGPEVPFSTYIGKKQECYCPVEGLIADTQGLAKWTFTVSRNFALYHTAKLLPWNVETYSDGHLISTHKLVNVYKYRDDSLDLFFCGTYKCVVDDWAKLTDATQNFEYIRCKLDDKIMVGSTGRFSTKTRYLFDINDENVFITGNYIGLGESDKEEFIFAKTGTQKLYYPSEMTDTESVGYLYASTRSGLYCRLQANIVEGEKLSLKLCGSLPFSLWDNPDYCFAISCEKRLRVPKDATRVLLQSINHSTKTVVLEPGHNFVFPKTITQVHFPVDASNDTANGVSEETRALSSSQKTSCSN